MSHTPGPFTLETRHHVHAICCVPTRKGEHKEVAFIEIAACQFPGAAPDDLSAGSITAQQRPREELLANARLFTAAPDLLAACEAAMKLRGGANQEGEAYALERGTKTHKAYCDKIEDQILGAIAKAKGEST